VPVGLIGSLPTMLVATPTVPASNVSELVAWLRANPGKVSYASNGAGSYAHVAMELFKRQAGLDVVHVPYRGAAQSDTDLMAGHVSLMFASLSVSAPLIAGGKLKAFGVSSRKRSPFAAGTPSIAESGMHELRDYVVVYWIGVMAPAGTPAAVTRRLNAEINAWLQTADAKDKLAARKIEAYGPTPPEEMTQLIRSETSRWAQVLRDAGIKPLDY